MGMVPFFDKLRSMYNWHRCGHQVAGGVCIMDKFISMTDLVTIISLVSVSISILAILLFLYSQRKHRSYDEINKKAQLNLFREAYENKIYNYNDKLCNSTDRWQDIFNANQN